MKEGGLSEAVTRDPRTVAGFARAVELGLTPVVPADPPAPVARNSSRFILGTVGWFIGALAVVIALANRGAPAWLCGLACAAGLAAVVGRLLHLRSIMWDEIRAGYCRMDYMVALFSRDPEYRFPANRMRGAPWDLRGLWRLADDDSVAAEPDRSVLPPGLYPSPNRPGELELWTGIAWAYRYERPRIPFL